MFEHDETPKDSYKVSFNLQGHGAVLNEYISSIFTDVKLGSKIKKPSDPTENGYVFTGWYKDAECTILWDFESDTVQGDIILYAGWEEN